MEQSDRDKLAELAKRYEADRGHYLSTEYNEHQLRTDFLDPLFELLGWDIKNAQGKPTNEREVIVEESLLGGVSTNAKKPDYTFRLFHERKFFLEAKKPNVSIESDATSSRQVRRYGFTAKLKISVLSNFEYLAIYDCSQKVEPTDSESHSRVKLYHYTEYLQATDEIAGLVSQESVYTGEFDKKWEHIEDQIKRFNVDLLFLDQINTWRQLLGVEIYKHKPDITNDVLNDIVQGYLNSIIFLRVCEDRDLERYEALLELANRQDFNLLIDRFRVADRKYNAGLFNQKLNNEILQNSESAFWTIIKQLYFPESTYSFAVFSSDILGNIYEIFLSQQLRIENGDVLLTKKPEHLDRDVVTTPPFIIQDILRRTVVEACKNKSDEQILTMRFADIACGSGSFLLETYQLINDLMIDFYIQNEPGKLIQTAVDRYKLPFETKRAIIQNCIFGVDKDYNAVQACRFGILIKLLEEENNQSIPTPALPDLSNNIQFGNSLISSADTDEKSRQEINPYDFNEQKFDVIVGNPPYMATEHMKQHTPKELPLYKKRYDVAFRQFDKYYLFIERGLELLKKEGYLGYVTPSKFVKVGAAKNLRKLFSENSLIEELVSFGANQIFQDKTTYTCILTIQKKVHKKLKYLEVENLNDWKTRNIDEDKYNLIPYDQLGSDTWILVPGPLVHAQKQIESQSKPLGELIGNDNIYNGIQTSANDVYVHAISDEDENYFYFNEEGETLKIERGLTKPYFETSSGIDNLNTYRELAPNAFVIYPYAKENERVRLIEIERLKAEFPNGYEYLAKHKDRLSERDIQPEPESKDEWYRYGRHQSLEKCDVPAKIVVGVLSQGNKYAIDYQGTLISSGGTAGYCMITVPPDSPYSIHYLQALLNSKYLEWYSSILGEVFRGGYIARGTKVLKELPIRTIKLENQKEKDIHDRIASLQQELIKIRMNIDKNDGNTRQQIPYQRQFKSTKEELDYLIKNLYGLEDDELIPKIAEKYAVT